MGDKIFIGGVHGVGKTYFCSQVSKELNLPHFSASELISQKKKEALSKNKKVSDITNNQKYLLEALEEIDAPIILLDGHFCLLNKDGDVVKISEETFKSIKPAGILILIDEPNHILLRLKQRDGIEHNTQTIKEFQQQEVDYAREVANKLCIPYIACKNEGNLTEITSFINSIIGGTINE